jgi:hypothetical protein
MQNGRSSSSQTPTTHNHPREGRRARDRRTAEETQATLDAVVEAGVPGAGDVPGVFHSLRGLLHGVAAERARRAAPEVPELREDGQDGGGLAGRDAMKTAFNWLCVMAVVVGGFFVLAQAGRYENEQRFARRYTVTLFVSGKEVRSWSAREKPRFNGQSWGGSTSWNFWTDSGEVSIVIGPHDVLMAE